jgi:hypothetical protein
MGLLLALLPAVARPDAAPPSSSDSPHITVQATYVSPAKRGGPSMVTVRFSPRDPDLRLNEEPGPRLRLDPAQTVLVEKRQVAAKVPALEPGHTRYLDTALPVVFPVGLGPGAVKGDHAVKGSLTYFYCSKREGWCRKGRATVQIPVLIR